MDREKTDKYQEEAVAPIYIRHPCRRPATLSTEGFPGSDGQENLDLLGAVCGLVAGQPNVDYTAAQDQGTRRRSVSVEPRSPRISRDRRSLAVEQDVPLPRRDTFDGRGPPRYKWRPTWGPGSSDAEDVDDVEERGHHPGEVLHEPDDGTDQFSHQFYDNRRHVAWPERRDQNDNAYRLDQDDIETVCYENSNNETTSSDNNGDQRHRLTKHIIAERHDEGERYMYRPEHSSCETICHRSDKDIHSTVESQQAMKHRAVKRLDKHNNDMYRPESSSSETICHRSDTETDLTVERRPSNNNEGKRSTTQCRYTTSTQRGTNEKQRQENDSERRQLSTVRPDFEITTEDASPSSTAVTYGSSRRTTVSLGTSPNLIEGNDRLFMVNNLQDQIDLLTEGLRRVEGERRRIAKNLTSSLNGKTTAASNRLEGVEPSRMDRQSTSTRRDIREQLNENEVETQQIRREQQQGFKDIVRQEGYRPTPKPRTSIMSKVVVPSRDTISTARPDSTSSDSDKENQDPGIIRRSKHHQKDDRRLKTKSDHKVRIKIKGETKRQQAEEDSSTVSSEEGDVSATMQDKRPTRKVKVKPQETMNQSSRESEPDDGRCKRERRHESDSVHKSESGEKNDQAGRGSRQRIESPDPERRRRERSGSHCRQRTSRSTSGHPEEERGGTSPRRDGSRRGKRHGDSSPSSDEDRKKSTGGRRKRHDDSSPSSGEDKKKSSGNRTPRDNCDDRDGNNNEKEERLSRRTPPSEKKSSTTYEHKKREIKPDKYDGNTCVETFLSKFSCCAKYNNWDSSDKAAYLTASLTGSAGLLLWDTKDASYEELVEKLRRRFGTREMQEKYRIEARHRKRKPNESLPELAQEMERIVRLAYPGCDTHAHDMLSRDHFIDALDSPGLEYQVKVREPQSLTHAVTVATKLEVLHNARELEKAQSRPRYARTAQANETAVKSNEANNWKQNGDQRRPNDGNDGNKRPNFRQREHDDEVSDLKKQVQRLTAKLQEIEVSARQPLPSSTQQPVSQQFSYGFPPQQLLPSHFQQQYLNSHQQPPSQPPSYNPYDRPPTAYYNNSGARPSGREATTPNFNCYGCGEAGHIRRNCPHAPQPLQETEDNGQRQNAPPRARGAAKPDGRHGRVYLDIQIRGRNKQCLLDTGCEISIIPANIVDRRTIRHCDQALLAANGTAIPTLGRATVQVQLGDRYVYINGLVSEHVSDVMLGIDWLETSGALWDFAQGMIILNGQKHRLSMKRHTGTWCRRVVLADNQLIPSRSQMDVATNMVYDVIPATEGDESTTWVTENHQMCKGLMVARTMLPDRPDRLPVRILNTTDQPVRVKKGTFVSGLQKLTPLEIRSTETVTPETEYDETLEDMIAQVDGSTPQHVRQELRSILYHYSSVFSKNELDLGWTDLVTHKIDVGDSKPIRQPMRRYPVPHLQAIDEHIENMRRQEVIEPANSPWASNIVLAKKKDGTLRCCVDYRQLNDVTKKDAYPLPRMDSCLDAMAGSSWFSTFDLRSGYHQVAMQPDDSEKTAFITRRGMYKFKTMPFGLCNAGATFQRLMDLVMSGLNLEVCLVYLDDIILFSTTPEEHLLRLVQVLERLKDTNLKLKPSKCRLFQKEVSFLGHIVSGRGIATDPEKVRLVKEWPVPTNLKQVRGFLGLTGYYRKFVKDYAKIAAPLNFLTRKNATFKWTDECQRAFNQLKDILSSPPILAMPNDEGTFVLDTDACEWSIGSVLSQVQQGQERVIAYAGRILSRNEVNYCITRKELLAIVHFTRHFRQYLLGRQFVVRTDHAALSWLKKTPDPIGQNARWLEVLGEYDYIIRHRPGTQHSNADAISRHPCLNRPSCTACHPPTATCAAVELVPPLNRVGTASQLNGSTDSVNGLPTIEEMGEEDEGLGNSAASSSDDDSSISVVTEKSELRLNCGGTASDEHETLIRRLQNNGSNTELVWSNIEMMIAQVEDVDVGFIREMMKSHQTKPPWKDVEGQSACVKSLWSEWERLALKNDVLCRNWTSIDGLHERWQVVLPRLYRKEFIQLCHSGMTGGHLGKGKTQEQIRLRAYWPNWTTDVRLELKRCAPCAQYHRGKAPRQSPLVPFLAGEPFETVAIDVTGKHPKSARGNEYMITAIDTFSKYAEAYPVRNHTAETVAKVLTDNFFTRYGMPKRILTDQGSEFESRLFKELCRHMGIEKVRTTPYKPSTNGCVERFHRTLNSMLGKVIQQSQRDWDEKVPTVMAAYRAARHESTGYSPNFVVFGRENRAPIDIVLGKVTEESQHYDSIDDYVNQLQETMRDSYALARDHLNESAGRRKDDYDIKVKSAEFTEGQKVWYFYPRRYVKRSPKWTKNYDGPFTVVRKIPPCDYVIQKSKRTTPQVVHCDKLKPYRCESEIADPPVDECEQTETTMMSESTFQQTAKKNPRKTVSWNPEVEIFDIPPKEEGQGERPRRLRSRPSRFDNYVT